MLSYLDYLVFLQAVFCTEQLYAFRRIIFSMFLRKKKLKITCPFCMGYRLTKMEDLQNALISRLFGVFAGGFLHRTTLCIPQNHFQHVFAKKKVENNLPILHGLQTQQNGGSSKCSHVQITCPFCMGYRLSKMEDIFKMLSYLDYLVFWCFCRRFFAQNISMHSVTYQSGGSSIDYLVFLHALFGTEHFQHVFAKKKVENNLPILHGLQTYQNGGSSKCSHISTIWFFSTHGFLHRTTLCIPQNHFQHVFAKKKVENELPILHGLQTYQNGGSSKCSHIWTIWCFCTRFFAQNNSMHSVESFSACFCEKKS